MTTEKPLQQAYISLLNRLELPFLHLTNAGLKRGTYHDCLGESCVKHLPDLIFPFNGRMYFRELGVEGRHKDRKAKQLFKAGWWAKHCNGDVKIITNEEAMMADWKEIGLIL